MQAARILIDKVRRSLQLRGVRGTLEHVLATAAVRVSGNDHRSELQAADAVLDAEFDNKYGVDTGGQIPVTKKDIDSENWVHASAYVPTDPIDLGALLSERRVRYEDTVFVDLGCGKGRILLLAQALPWKRVVGVEFSKALAAIARDNLMRYTGPRVCTNATVEIDDAAAYAWPDTDVVVFMYHPFQDSVMSKVVANLEAAHARMGRRIVIFYWKPVYAEVIDRSTRWRRVVSAPQYNIWDTEQT